LAMGSCRLCIEGIPLRSQPDLKQPIGDCFRRLCPIYPEWGGFMCDVAHAQPAPLLRAVTTGERTPWTSCQGRRECCPFWRLRQPPYHRAERKR